MSAPASVVRSSPPPPLPPPSPLPPLQSRSLSSPSRQPWPVATARLLAIAAVAGLAINLVVRTEHAGVGAALLPVVIGALLVAARALPNRDARWVVGAAAVVAPWLAVRTSPWVVAVDTVVIIGILLVAVSIGCRRPLLGQGVVAWFGAVGNLVESTVMVFPFIGRGAGRLVGGTGWTPARRAVARGLAIALPGALLCAALLASADAGFASLFARLDSGLWGHAAMTLVGLVAFAALALAASTDVAAGPATRRQVGAIEALTIVGTYVVLYAVFVASRLIDTPLVVHDTPAEVLSDAARAGFFQLVAVAALTLGMLVWVRSRAVVTATLRVAIAAAAGLTLTIVGIALHRLDAYRDRYGLTGLRLSTTWFSWWLGLIFALVAVSTVVRLGRSRWVTIVLVSALGWVVAWNAINPEAVIARANLDRVATSADVGRDRYDSSFTVTLSADAVPTIVDRFAEIPAEHQATVQDWLCLGSRRSPGGLSWNLARFRAVDFLAEFC